MPGRHHFLKTDLFCLFGSGGAPNKNKKKFIFIEQYSRDPELYDEKKLRQKILENIKVIAKTKLEVNFAKSEIRILIFKYANFGAI